MPSLKIKINIFIKTAKYINIFKILHKYIFLVYKKMIYKQIQIPVIFLLFFFNCNIKMHYKQIKVHCKQINSIYYSTCESILCTRYITQTFGTAQMHFLLQQTGLIVFNTVEEYLDFQYVMKRVRVLICLHIITYYLFR